MSPTKLSVCNRRETNRGVLRCELEANHKEECGTFVNDKWRSWPKPPLQTPQKSIFQALKRSELGRGKGLNQESEKGAAKKQTWRFIRSCFVMCQLRTDGHLSCMRCGRVIENRRNAHLHHMEHAGKGGAWTLQNAELICGGFEGSCHSQEHGEPIWSAGESA